MNTLPNSPRFREGTVPTWELLQMHKAASRRGWPCQDYATILQWFETYCLDDDIVSLWRGLAFANGGV